MFGLGKKEPVGVAGLVRTLLLTAVTAGYLDLNLETIGAIAGVAAALEVVIGIWVRNRVTSQATLEKAGTSQKTVTALAYTRTGPPSFESRL